MYKLLKMESVEEKVLWYDFMVLLWDRGIVMMLYFMKDGVVIRNVFIYMVIINFW